jgi:2-(1,2-epoxy-1,2-dihydrophenyl)acetyl-CoA isomerase
MAAIIAQRQGNECDIRDDLVMTVLDVRDGIGTITLSNPRGHNVLDDVTRLEVLEALREAQSDTHCAAIVLTGANGTFCAGGELSSMPRDEPAIRKRLGEMHDIVRLVHAGSKPVVAAVDGVAFGSGLSLAAASDQVIATETARFGCTFSKVGLIADTGLFWTLPRRVGPSAARRILLAGRIVDAVAGKELGLVDEIVSRDDLLPRSVAWASTFAEAAPLPLAATRRLMANPGRSLNELLDAELNAQIELLASDDFAEGRTAFFEKRTPDFRGQ